jgi:hypothetical protein
LRHNYWKLKHKIQARKNNVCIYRDITNRKSIPDDKGYWTLCNYQPLNQHGVEIEQMEEMGLVKKSNFYGVDREKEIIEQNRIWHPEAHWYWGDWNHVIRECDDFNPALIYLDLINFSCNRKISGIVSSTMLLCPINTILLVNVMLNDPRSSIVFQAQDLIRNLEKIVPSLELEKWMKEIKNYNYNATGKTEMITYVFYKEKE